MNFTGVSECMFFNIKNAETPINIETLKRKHYDFALIYGIFAMILTFN